MAASSDSEEESFVELGKPLPFIEGEGKVKPLTLQDAPQRSSQDGSKGGRPRFHGAFTGGFSAGYFNSVGSKEGWTPSLFVSSRAQKQQDAPTRQPEDFMDEEDLGEHGIAPRKFATSDAFSSDAQNRKRRAEVESATRDSVLPASSALTDLIVPERLPIGIRLLRKMGWKEGQGIGPRVKKANKKQHKGNKAAGVKIYGCPLPPGSDEENESDPSDLDLKDVTFAPKDVTPISLTPKDNVHGLGYRGIDPRSALPGGSGSSSRVGLFDPPPVRSSKSRKGIRGQAFGVGALEDDDDDIYTQDSLSNYDQTMELDDSEQFFGWTAPGARKARGKKQDQQPVSVSYVGKMLEGFSLSAKPLPVKKVFPPPTLPSGFRPFHKFKKTVQQLAQEAVGETPVPSGQQPPGGSQSKLTAVERGLMLDERPIATSVFDLIPKEDIRRMEAVKESAKMAAVQRFQSAGVLSTQTPNNSDNDPTPAAQTSSSLAVVMKPTSLTGEEEEKGEKTGVGGLGVKPFHRDPPKQARYERYLALSKESKKDPYDEVSSSHMTEWERQREREEFSKAAKIYGPLSHMMASRFTRGAFIDDSAQPRSGLLEAVAEKSEEAKAAEMKMYGKLTREEMEWHPHNLLCKRFNVPNPYPESDIVGVPGLKRDKFSIFNFMSVPTATTHHGSKSKNGSQQQLPEAAAVTNSLTRELNASKRRKGGAMSIFRVLEEEETTRKALPLPPSADNDEDGDSKAETDTKDDNDERTDKDDDQDDDDSRPKDLFRAIFKNSDSESSSASEKSDDDRSDDDSDVEEKKEVDKDEATPLQSDDKYDSSSTRRRSLSPHTPPGPPPPLPPSSSVPLPPPPTSSSDVNVPARSAPPRKRNRWDVPRSIFDVLDQSPPHRTSSEPAPQKDDEGEKEDGVKGGERLRPLDSESGDVDMYGPALPPGMPTGASSRSYTSQKDAGAPREEDLHRKHKSKHKERERDSSKHRHKKEKKKKSKHKKEKKKKKKSKHSHNRPQSRGSEADSDSDSDS